MEWHHFIKTLDKKKKHWLFFDFDHAVAGGMSPKTIFEWKGAQIIVLV